MLLAAASGAAASQAAGTGRGRGATASPLLTYDAARQTAFMQALSGGTLVRDGRCLYLVAQSRRTLLVLPAPQARWNARRSSLSIGGREFRLGDEIRIGGGEGRLATGPLAREARRRGCDTRRVWWGSPEILDAPARSPSRRRAIAP